MPKFKARLTTIRVTPSRSEDANDVCRLSLEGHDMEVDPIRRYLDQQLIVPITPAMTPIEEAIAEASTNGVADEPVAIPSNGRRRRGTVANPTQDEE